MPESESATPPAAAREPRRVGTNQAFAWYSEALRLFKRRPFEFAGLSVAIIVAELVISLIPVIGRPAANVVVPLLASSLLFASLATDRDDRPRVTHLVAPFAAPVSAIAAVILASLVVFLAEWLVAWHLADVNLLANHDPATLGPVAIFAIYTTGVAVSLPLTLVPLLAFFEQSSVKDAFAGSIAAFTRNVPAFLLYGALSIALLGLALITMGVGFAIALPLWAASSYAAWKNLFGLDR
jgi:uncharacterized membrane protein